MPMMVPSSNAGRSDQLSNLFLQGMQQRQALAQQAQQLQQQETSMIGRIMLQDVLRKSGEEERAKRTSGMERINKGWRDVTGSMLPGPDGTTPGQENVIPDQFGRSWLPPSANIPEEAQEHVGAFSTGVPGKSHFYTKPQPKYKPGDTREIKMGGNLVTQEFTKEKGFVDMPGGSAPRFQEKGVNVFNEAEGRKLSLSPDKARALLAKSPGWKQGTPYGDAAKVELKPAAALKRQSAIIKSMETLDKTDQITAMMIAIDPDLAPMLGQTMSPDQKTKIMDAYNKELSHLQNFIPEKLRSGSKSTAQGVTKYTYTEQGELVGQ